MKRIFPILFSLIALGSCQPERGNPYSLNGKIKELGKSIQEKGYEAWYYFRKENRNPLPLGDSVAFLYYGEASSVQWAGDFNGWSGREPKAVGKNIDSTNLWYAIIALPRDARIDYKVIVDGSWTFDPDNPFKQMTGVGGGTYNSELRMPEWKEDPTGREREEVTRGTVSEMKLLESESMGYGINYKVYLPAGYESLENLPSLYVTDGQEYSHPEMGNMVRILDNLIFDKKIKPLVVVFIDPRNPENANENRRMTELVLNPDYAQFVTDELIPEVDANYKTSKNADDRGILGTSLGGLNSAYFNAVTHDYFHLIGINSPAFQYKPEIYSIYDTLQSIPSRIIMTTGVIHDTEEGSRKMKEIMEKKNYPLKYIETNQGHSWGNWKGLLDDVLIYLYGEN